MAMASFRRNRMAMICLWILWVLYGMAGFADVVCPYGYQDEDRNYSYCPPTKIEFRDHGHWMYPFVYKQILTFNAMHRRIFVTDFTQKYQLHFFKAGRLIAVDHGARFYIW